MADTNMDDCASVLRGKYPAKAHARRVAEYLRANDRSGSYPTAVLYLEGRMTKLLEDSDMEEPFRQRRFFYYLTGCSLPDCYFVYDMAADRSILFIPPVDSANVMWSGLPMSLEEARSAYDVDEVRYAAAVPPTLVSLGEKSSPSRSKVYAIANQVSHHVTFVQFDEKDFGLLRTGIETCRVVKDEYEIALIRRANDISRDAHHAAMRAAARARNETEVHAAFLEACVTAGAKNQAYDTIVASGRAAATLHYIRNDQPMDGKQNLLLDGGCEWDCYASDVTRTYPISGKFTAESRAIYDLVLQMQQRSLDAIKAGVRWEDVHTIAHRVAIDGLLKLGILRGDRDAIFQSRTSVAFFPHGLGHYLGLDTHDTGGNADYQDPDPMFRYLRIRGLLPEGSVVTVEPGIYFSNFIIGSYLDDEKHARFIDGDVLEKYWPVGGVRIEDNVVVTRTGFDNLTTAIKDSDEIEALVGRLDDS